MIIEDGCQFWPNSPESDFGFKFIKQTINFQSTTFQTTYQSTYQSTCQIFIQVFSDLMNNHNFASHPAPFLIASIDKSRYFSTFLDF